MAAVFTRPSSVGSQTPIKVLAADVSRTTTTVVRNVVGTSDPYVSLGEAGLRAGRLELLYDTDTEVEAAEEFFSVADVYTLTFPERPSLEMAFVIGPAGTRRFYQRPRWVFELAFQEV